MTNKLPVVCNKYTNRITGTVYKAFKHKARENCYFMESQSESPNLVVNLDNFWAEFEERPEDKAETKPETQSHISELSPEVKEAMAELRSKYNKLASGNELESIFNAVNKDLLRKIYNLINALEKQFYNQLGEEK